MASTSGVAEAATKSLLMSIRRSLIHCGSMYINNLGSTASIDERRRDVGQPRCNLKSTSPARKSAWYHTPVLTKTWTDQGQVVEVRFGPSHDCWRLTLVLFRRRALGELSGAGPRIGGARSKKH